VRRTVRVLVFPGGLSTNPRHPGRHGGVNALGAERTAEVIVTGPLPCASDDDDPVASPGQTCWRGGGSMKTADAPPFKHQERGSTPTATRPHDRPDSGHHPKDYRVQATHVMAPGTATRRSVPMGWPQAEHVP
jgi:hypothetical protein